jgi:hypothetical protein
MALEAAFAELTTRLRSFQELLEGLGFTTGQDRSDKENPILAASIDDTVVELQDWLKNALAEAVKAEKALSPRVDLNRVRRHLAASQQVFQELSEAIGLNLLSYDRVAEVIQFGLEKGPQWTKWTNAVRQWLDGIRPQLDAVLRSYFVCWQETAERAAVSSVSVQATGQHIEVGAQGIKETAEHEFT